MNGIKLRYFLLSLLACFLAAFIGSYFTAGSVKSWYPTLVKPPLNPPTWLFGPVWTALYFMMALACSLVWSTKTKNGQKKDGLRLFFIQLVFNSLWSLIFFGLKLPSFAFGGIIALWLFIFFTIARFYRVNRYASFLMMPYIAWVSFAAVLNYYIAVLN